MKKKLVFIAIIVFSIIIQPFSLNYEAFAKNIEKDELSDCGCNKEEELNVKDTGVFKNEKVINNVKKSLRNKEESKQSAYKQGDFNWKNVEYLDFDKDKEGLMVPYKKNNSSTDIRLLTAYDKKNNEITDIIIMKSILKGENIKTSYSSLLNDVAVTLTIDTNTNQVIDVNIPDNKEAVGLIKLSKASAGYKDDTVNCLKTYWSNATGFTKTVCSAACGSAIFGGNPLSYTVCASCLGAYAMVCLIH